MPTVLAMLPGRAPLALATTMRGSVSSRILPTSCPVMPSLAPSHWIMQFGRAVGEIGGRLVDLGGDAVHALHAGGDVVEPGFPLRPFGLVVALDPHLHGGQHAHDFFFADFHGASEGVVRRAVDPGSLQQALVAEQQAGGLRTADALAAAVGHGMWRRAPGERWASWSGFRPRHPPAPGRSCAGPPRPPRACRADRRRPVRQDVAPWRCAR